MSCDGPADEVEDRVGDGAKGKEGRRMAGAAPEPQESGSTSVPRLREITDPRTLRALAHPVRIALMEVLLLEGPMTATEAGEHIGESPSSCSFHLRQLAKHGFVEEAGGRSGRARPWRVSTIGMQVSSRADDPEMELASNAVLQLLRERQLERYRRWLETKASFSPDWRKAADESQFLLHLTAAELQSLSDELLALVLSRFPERLTDPSTRPPGTAPIEMLVFSYPIALPGEQP